MKHEVVHVTTQKQWDIVTKKLKYTFSSDIWNNYKENSCINLKNEGYADTNGSAYGHSNAIIYSFDEWCEINKINKINMKEKGMQELMLEILNKTYDNLILRRTTVPLFMSNPGVGKSTIIKEFAEERKVKMVKITLSQRMPNEVVGMVI